MSYRGSEICSDELSIMTDMLQDTAHETCPDRDGELAALEVVEVCWQVSYATQSSRTRATPPRMCCFSSSLALPLLDRKVCVASVEGVQDDMSAPIRWKVGVPRVWVLAQESFGRRRSTRWSAPMMEEPITHIGHST